MPERIDRLHARIMREYERKGYSRARAREIAWATLNKLGMLRRSRKEAP